MFKRYILISLINTLILFEGKCSEWNTIDTSIDSFKTCSLVDDVNHRLYFSSTIFDQNYFPITTIRYWDGESSHDLNYQFHGLINVMIIFQEKLIVGGMFKHIDDQSIINLAQVTEDEVTSLGILDTQYNGSINTMTIYNDLLYIGGDIQFSNTIATWDGSFLNYLSESPNHPVLSLCVYNDNLIVGGKFNKVNNLNCDNIAKWDGYSWDSVVNGLFGYILTMKNFKGDLYIGGAFANDDSLNPIISIAILNNETWNPVDMGVFFGIFSMTEYNNELYIGGVFEKVGEELMVNNFAKWNGTEWSTCDEGINTEDEEDEIYVSSFQVFDGSLYIFGKFDIANTSTCNNIVKYHF